MWIDVEERLPDDRTCVLGFDGILRHSFIGFLFEGKWFAIDGSGGGVVTHWQPLPEPPASRVGNNRKVTANRS